MYVAVSFPSTRAHADDSILSQTEQDPEDVSTLSGPSAFPCSSRACDGRSCSSIARKTEEAMEDVSDRVSSQPSLPPSRDSRLDSLLPTSRLEGYVLIFIFFLVKTEAALVDVSARSSPLTLYPLTHPRLDLPTLSFPPSVDFSALSFPTLRRVAHDRSLF